MAIKRKRQKCKKKRSSFKNNKCQWVSRRLTNISFSVLNNRIVSFPWNRSMKRKKWSFSTVENNYWRLQIRKFLEILRKTKWRWSFQSVPNHPSSLLLPTKWTCPLNLPVIEENIEANAIGKLNFLIWNLKKQMHVNGISQPWKNFHIWLDSPALLSINGTGISDNK